ncbi:DUF3892 domain-containing protein [Natranaerofaba carboxydovora]|uniref:DUF3892 domain-containing protein n=1 Tax=Natranaerofaba carboxydovora TaxID=2742683 RepID=UPI001F1445C2|nr:DUF3892 domain-containing protein [Natranaerofaba carboxydovora]UMZ73788.1 hypothetical protein ACONDI_01357 [Natranaerofaba carboxydovora]
MSPPYRISRVSKDDRGNIVQVMLNDGRIFDISTVIEMAESGLIENVNTGATRNGEKTLRSDPDKDPDNNLDNLPRF